jgi:hypothetical protein
MGMFRGVSKATTVNLTIAANTANYNIFTAAGSPSGVANVTVTVNSGVVVYGSGFNTTTLSYYTAMDTGTGWASGSTITLINNGTISGQPGFGAGGVSAVSAGNPGGTGYIGLAAQTPITITNNGIIAGGGGGGGSGGGRGGGSNGSSGDGGDGGGGNTTTGAGSQGLTNATGAGAGGNALGSTLRYGNDGGSGSTTGGGGGGGGGYWGHPGGIGGTASTSAGGSSGKAGAAYTGSSNITWAVTGTRLGTADNGNYLVNLGGNVNDTLVSTSSASQSQAQISILTDGTVFYQTGSHTGATITAKTWCWYAQKNFTIGNSHWVRATLQSGTTPTSNPGMGTWLQISSTLLWQNLRPQTSGVGNTTSTILFEFSTSATGSPVVNSGTVVLNAIRT